MAKLPKSDTRWRIEGSPRTLVPVGDHDELPETLVAKLARQHFGWRPSLAVERLAKYDAARADGCGWDEAINLIAHSEDRQFGEVPDKAEKHRAAIERSITRGRTKRNR